MSEVKLITSQKFAIVGDVEVAYLFEPIMCPGILHTLESTVSATKFPGVRIQLTTTGGLLLTKGNLVAFVSATSVKIAKMKDFNA